MKPPTIHILLVEDNLPDVVLTRKAFEKSQFACFLHIVRDGEEALNFLKGKSARLPDLILLDVNLPKKSGYDVLQELKSDISFMHIPVIMLTSSSSEEDILKSYRLHANSYVVKPASLSEYVQLITQIECFWFNSAVLRR